MVETLTVLTPEKLYWSLSLPSAKDSLAKASATLEAICHGDK